MPRRVTSLFLSVLIVGSLLLAGSLQAEAAGPKKWIPQPAPAAGDTLEWMSPDLAVTIEVRLLRKVSDTEALVAIDGVVRNISDRNFHSSPGQQRVIFVKHIPRRFKPMQFDQRGFTSLAAGESLLVGGSMNWQTTQQSPPSFELYLDYAPDNQRDGNLGNDDTDKSNDRAVLSGSSINSIVRRLLARHMVRRR